MLMPTPGRVHTFVARRKKGVAGFVTGQEVSLNRMGPRKQTKSTDVFLTTSTGTLTVTQICNLWRMTKQVGSSSA